MAAEAAALRPRADGDAVMFATKTAMRMLGRRVLALDDEEAELDELMSRLVADTAPDLLAVYGVGVDTAAILLVAAGDNPERLRSEAAWRRERSRCGTASEAEGAIRVRALLADSGASGSASQRHHRRCR